MHGHSESIWDVRLREAQTLKEDGNDWYRTSNYSGAINKYKLALMKLDVQQQDSDVAQLTTQQMDTFNRLLVDCHNNLAG